MFSIAEKNTIYMQKELYSQLGFNIHKEGDDIFTFLDGAVGSTPVF